jgi:hypothetical protein
MVYGNNIEQIAVHVEKMVASKMSPEEIVSVLIKNGVQKDTAVKLVQQKFARSQTRGIPASPQSLTNDPRKEWEKYRTPR